MLVSLHTAIADNGVFEVFGNIQSVVVIFRSVEYNLGN